MLFLEMSASVTTNPSTKLDFGQFVITSLLYEETVIV